MAGLTTTQTFSDGDTVTAAKLNNIVGNASIDADAVTTAKILDANVTLGKMATLSVDTGQLVDDAVQNSKLENMAASTVKANATSGSANPTDVAVAANKLLAGTSDSINAVSFTTDLELDASDSAATLIRASATLIGGKASVTADELDEILIKDATDGALKRATVKTAVQSQVATTVATGVCELATAAKLIDPSGAASNDVVPASTGSPMLAKAWGYLITSGGAIVAGSFLQNCTVSYTTTGTFAVTFSPTDVPSLKYMVMGNGRSGAYARGLQVVSSSLATTGFTFVTVDTEDTSGAARDPDGGVQFVVYGLTS
jgi:hypothetical protein